MSFTRYIYRFFAKLVFKKDINVLQRRSLFELSDLASNQTANQGHELSNPSSSAGFNFIYTSGGCITWETFTRNNKSLCSVIKFQISCSDTSRKCIKVSTNQAFIEFQTRAIFIFEQSQVGCARSEPRPGSSPLCAIRATVVSTRHSPLLTGSTLSHPPFPSLSFSHSPLCPLGFRLTTLLSRAFRRKPTPREDTELRYVYTRTALSFSTVL